MTKKMRMMMPAMTMMRMRRAMMQVNTPLMKRALKVQLTLQMIQ